MVYYKRNYAHHVPTTYRKLKPDRGEGFILMQLFERGFLSRRAIFEGSERYGEYRPGLLSMCFTDLIEKGLITVVNGYMKEYAVISHWDRPRKRNAYRAVASKGRTPIYAITQKGIDLINRKSEQETIE